MGRPRKDPNAGMVVARDACVIVVGARPPVYEKITVIHNKTGLPVEMNSDRIIDEGSEGIPYTFRPYQRVPRSHPAVKDSPSSFMDVDALSDAELELVVA